jgi:hypothetical protein
MLSSCVMTIPTSSCGLRLNSVATATRARAPSFMAPYVLCEVGGMLGHGCASQYSRPAVAAAAHSTPVGIASVKPASGRWLQSFGLASSTSISPTRRLTAAIYAATASDGRFADSAQERLDDSLPAPASNPVLGLLTAAMEQYQRFFALAGKRRGLWLGAAKLATVCLTGWPD